MLVLARKLNQQIVIADNIYIKVVRMDGDVVKLGIQAPASVPVHRQGQHIFFSLSLLNLRGLLRALSLLFPRRSFNRLLDDC